MKKTIYCIIFGIFIFLAFPIEAHCEPLVVVIDPGHGGEALGGNMDERIERDINLITANAMKDRLLQYDNVEVFLTRDNNDQPDITKKNRLKTAHDKNADFFFSIHYNMSENHNLYGTEVWTPMTGTLYSQTMECAAIIDNDLCALGLFDRGLKHRSAKNGSEYYGILKYGVEYNIPSIIIEHCHLDNENDSAFWNEDAYINFGIVDADAVAKYFRLSSSTLGVDYSGFERQTFEVPSGPVREDKTPPEECSISLLEADVENAMAKVMITASDSDGYIQYYSLSFDNGVTYKELESWPQKDSTSCMVSVPLKTGEDTQLTVEVFNQYDLYLASDTITLPSAKVPKQPTQEVFKPSVVTIEQEVTFTPRQDETDVVLIVTIIVSIMILILFSVIIVLKIQESKRRKRRKKKKR